MKLSPDDPMFDANALAVRYYFGDLDYYELPKICVQALENGFDGRALRRLAGLINPVARDMRPEEIEAAFREMGVNAPISKDAARLALAAEAAKRALTGGSNVFNEATHIRIHLCEFHKAPPELKQVVDLSRESEHAPPSEWKQLEKRLHGAMSEFLNTQK
jgi:hypothetical protein